MQFSQREAKPQFSQPVRQIFMMLVAVGLFSFGAYVAYPRVAPVFLANPYLNGVIGLVFVIGVMACFWQALQLVSSVNWIEGFAQHRPGHEITRVPRLLAPLAALLRERGARTQISASSARSILESVATRIEELRDITRYIVNLLIFLGLLGTFYGLATTVPAVVETIRSLAPQDGEGGVEVFSRLMVGLEEQLGGMGTAFASSLLGLAGSLVVGLLELFAGHGQNRFYRELEEWLSTITRLGFAGGEGDGTDADAMTAVLVQMSDQMDAQMEALQTVVNTADSGNRAVADHLDRLAGAIASLTQQGPASDLAPLLTRIASGQEQILAALQARGTDPDHVDAEARMRLRSIDVQLLRILEEISAGRQESMAELRGELHALVRALHGSSESGG